MKFEIWKADDEYGNEHYVRTLRADSAEQAEEIYVTTCCADMSEVERQQEMSVIYAKTSEQI